MTVRCCTEMTTAASRTASKTELDCQQQEARGVVSPSCCCGALLKARCTQHIGQCIAAQRKEQTRRNTAGTACPGASAVRCCMCFGTRHCAAASLHCSCGYTCMTAPNILLNQQQQCPAQSTAAINLGCKCICRGCSHQAALRCTLVRKQPGSRAQSIGGVQQCCPRLSRTY